MPLGPEKIQEKENCGKILGAGGDLSFGLLEGCRPIEPVSGVLVCLAARTNQCDPTHMFTFVNLCLSIPNFKSLCH